MGLALIVITLFLVFLCAMSLFEYFMQAQSQKNFRAGIKDIPAKADSSNKLPQTLSTPELDEPKKD